ncbi:MAG: ABC transporter permease [Pseudomonadota bacterium]
MTDITPPLPPRSRASADDDGQLREVHLPFATSRAIFALILREMTTSYGRSPGGYVWAVLEPVAGIALLTAIFSAGFRHPPLGTSFALFYATGILPFLMYADVAGKLSQTLAFSRALLEYPRVTFVDALVARFLLNTLTQFMVHFVVMWGVLTFVVGDVTIDMGKMALAYVMIIALAIGIGTINSFLTLAYPVWQTVWAVVNRPMFLVSCMFYLFETVPQPYRDMLWFNPLVHPVGMMRDAYYPYYNPSYISVVYTMIVALSATLIGLFLLNRYHRDILDK